MKNKRPNAGISGANKNGIIMKNNLSFFFAPITFLLFFAVANFADEPVSSVPKSIRFYSGKVLSAELMPSCPNIPTVLNEDKNPSRCRITSDLAYASVVVRLDKGRSLSIHDYVLMNMRKDVFKCIAISEADGPFDAEKWCFNETSPDKLYTMLFKVQLPVFNEPNEYILRFNFGKYVETVALPFVKIEEGSFSPSSKIPQEGIMDRGINIKKTKPPTEEEPAIKEEVPAPPS